MGLCRNIEEVRKIYEEISQNPPYVKELYSCMLNCELVACKKEGKVGFDKCKDLENLENIHKRACQQFESDADVWLNYMNFVKTHTEKDEILVFNQATRKLKGIQLIHFKHKCGVFNKELN